MPWYFVKQWNSARMHTWSYGSASPSTDNHGHSSHVCNTQSTGNGQQRHMGRTNVLLLWNKTTEIRSSNIRQPLENFRRLPKPNPKNSENNLMTYDHSTKSRLWSARGKPNLLGRFSSNKSKLSYLHKH